MKTTQRLAELATTGSPSTTRFTDFGEYSSVIACTQTSIERVAEHEEAL